MKVIGIKGTLLIDPSMEITPTSLEDVPSDDFIHEYLKTLGDFKHIILGSGIARNNIWEYPFELTDENEMALAKAEGKDG